MRRRQTVLGPRPFRRANPVLALPAILLLAAFYLLPNALNLVLGFTDWNAFDEAIDFNGLDNFRRLASSGVLETAITTTLVFAVTVMVTQNLLGLALALGLERTNQVNGILRTVFFVPVLISPVAAGYIFRGLLAPGGTVNALLGTIAGEPVTVAWLGSREITLFVVALIQAWKGVGITMLIYLSGLAAIPGEYEEAARVDGANSRDVVRRIKLPLLAPALTANLVLTMIGAIGAFDIILATTKGGPGRATAVINYVLYQQFSQGLFGMATAVNLVVFVMVLIASVPLIVYLRRREVQL
jgi:ABC-type sugar transport system permease subunit